MSDIGFTGTSEDPGLFDKQWSNIEEFLAGAEGGKFRHGSCRNADEQAGWIAHRLGYWVVVYPPTDRKKRAFCWYDELQPEQPYPVRNRALVNDSRYLLVAPSGPEVLRSGEWSTARYAIKLGRDGMIFWRNGGMTPLREYESKFIR